MREVDDLLRSAYRQLRGRDLPESIPTRVLLSLGIEKSRDLVRGEVRALAYRGSGGLHFRGARTNVRNPQMLLVGRAVVFGPDVVVDAFSIKGISLGNNVTVARGASLLGSGVLREPGVGVLVGDNSAIGAHNVIWGQGGVVIGQDCLFAPQVMLVSENHTFDNPDQPIRTQPEARAAITIGDDCWLGAGVKVVAGVRIGSGCVVGAGAVVTKSLPAGSIAVGVPARIIGTR